MTEKLTVPTLKKRLDVLIKVVRYRDSPDGEHNYCRTCATPTALPIKELQCGHFVKRGNQHLKYHPCNMMPQCRRCNHFLDGAQDKAAVEVLLEYGDAMLKHLVATDYAWLRGELPSLKREDYVDHYNYWLRVNRTTEKKWGVKIIPKTWELAE